MSKLLNYLFILSINLLIICNYAKCRKLSLQLNPNCPKDNNTPKEINLAYIKSQSDQDLIHYLWSSTKCIPPSLIIAKSDLKTTLTVDCNSIIHDLQTDCSGKELRNFVNFGNGSVTNSIEFQIEKLILFSDVNKTGSYQLEDSVLDVKWDSSNGFVWNETKKIEEEEDSVQLSFTNHQNLTAEINGIITFDLRIEGSDGRTEKLPQMAFTDSGVSLQLTVYNLTTNATEFPNPRLMAVIDLSNGKNESKADFDEKTKIDDEYSPGVFKQIILNLKQEKTKENEEVVNSYVYWKPIAYIKDERISANSLDVVHSIIEDDNSTSNLKHRFNLTFGASDDTKTYYDKEKFSTFSMVVGIGSAPEDELSLLVKMVIVVGFGLPALIIFVSAVYIIVRKVRNRNANNLLLSHSNPSLDNSRQ